VGTEALALSRSRMATAGGLKGSPAALRLSTGETQAMMTVEQANLRAAAALESLEDMRHSLTEAMNQLQHAGHLIKRPHHDSACYCLNCSWWHDYLELRASL
jgi:hypothetical protein